MNIFILTFFGKNIPLTPYLWLYLKKYLFLFCLIYLLNKNFLLKLILLKREVKFSIATFYLKDSL